MFVANKFERVISKDFEDAGELIPEQRESILNHIMSFDGRWQDYDVLVNGAPKKGVQPIYNDKQVVRNYWTYKYNGLTTDDQTLYNTFQRQFREVRLKQITIVRYVCYSKQYLEVLLECSDPCWKSFREMTLKDVNGLYFSPRVTPIWKMATYKANLSKNNAQYEEKSFSLLVSQKVASLSQPEKIKQERKIFQQSSERGSTSNPSSSETMKDELIEMKEEIAALKGSCLSSNVKISELTPEFLTKTKYFEEKLLFQENVNLKLECLRNQLNELKQATQKLNADIKEAHQATATKEKSRKIHKERSSGKKKEINPKEKDEIEGSQEA